MNAAILIGNGINRCYEGSIPWGNLLQSIANDYNVSFNHCNPFPLEFESITNQILSMDEMPSDAIYKRLKKKIAESISVLQPADKSLHAMFTKDLPVNHILTTNYDYMLEQSFCVSWEKGPLQKDTTETKYSLNRYAIIGGKYFYHIHGEANNPTTLCLGYEHYAGYLAKMRDYLKAAPNISQRINEGIVPEKESWLNLFFTHDIYIVGLTLDHCEIDLWWLITYRAYLYYSNDNELRNLMKNKITFYDTDCKRNKDKEELFRNLHIEYQPVDPINKNYFEAYKKIKIAINDAVEKRKAL